MENLTQILGAILEQAKNLAISIQDGDIEAALVDFAKLSAEQGKLAGMLARMTESENIS